MKAAVFDGQNVSIKEVPIPALGESQVLIQITASGICGTDIAIAKGDLPVPTPISAVTTASERFFPNVYRVKP